jgi:hypothetical protein
LPGIKPFPVLAREVSFTNENPETIQNGRSTSKVKMRLTRKEGVSPEFKYILDRKNIIPIEMAGLREKIRFIFLISVRGEVAASFDPKDEPISHDPRKIPVTSSYPPAILSISRSIRSCTAELTKPTRKRFMLITEEESE